MTRAVRAGSVRAGSESGMVKGGGAESGGAEGEGVSLRVGFRAQMAYREILMRRGVGGLIAGAGLGTGLVSGAGVVSDLGVELEGYPLQDAYGLLSPLNYEDCEEMTVVGVEIVDPPAPSPPATPPIGEPPHVSSIIYTTF